MTQTAAAAAGAVQSHLKRKWCQVLLQTREQAVAAHQARGIRHWDQRHRPAACNRGTAYFASVIKGTGHRSTQVATGIEGTGHKTTQ
eukprot:213420-Pelagomonas_calceolata.AAC.3